MCARNFGLNDEHDARPRSKKGWSPNLAQIGRCCCCCPESCPGWLARYKLWIRSPKDLGQAGSGFSRVRRRIGCMNNFFSANNFPPPSLPLSSAPIDSNQPVRMFLILTKKTCLQLAKSLGESMPETTTQEGFFFKSALNFWNPCTPNFTFILFLDPSGSKHTSL